MSYRRSRGSSIRFSSRELRDLAAAWLALGVAFTVFFAGGGAALAAPGMFSRLLLISLLTAGVGFLLHELAHKLVAIRFGQLAEFRASYPMLAIAIAFAFAGFIFAAPGAVYHRGHITTRENGIIALAGPVTNLGLGLLFVPLLFAPGGFLTDLGRYGVLINFFLAAFNLIPFGPLDGRKVREWGLGIFVLSFVVSLILLAGAILILLL